MRRFIRIIVSLSLLMISTGCGTATSPSIPPTGSVQATPQGATAQPGQTTLPVAASDLSGIKNYLLAQATELVSATNRLQVPTNQYYELAQSAKFDYKILWEQQKSIITPTIQAAQDAWRLASPLYEKMEGIVAGTPSLSDYDVILDAGASGEDDPENAAPYDITLPDGRVLKRPGNIFGVTESTLWGTFPAFASGVDADWNGNGTLDLGESLPDANVLKGGVEALSQYAKELLEAAKGWTPTEKDAFHALITMVPTMTEYFNSWRDSRFVTCVGSTQRDFVAISRLADIQDILSGLEIIYAQVRPRVEVVDPAQAGQIAQGLSDLRSFVTDIYAREQSGTRFTTEEADVLGAEAQNRATAITGQISQVAAQLNIPIED